MRTIIAGSRTITDPAQLAAAVAASGFRPQITAVLSGGARGVDELGEQWAHAQGLPLSRWPAFWRRHRKAAGCIRNAVMVKHADALVAVWDGRSAGTRHIVALAQAAGLAVYVHRTN